MPRGVNSRMHRTETPKPFWIKFCKVVDITDIVTYTNFGDHRLRVFWVAGGHISPFPIDFHRRPYNTLTLPCECVITQCCTSSDVTFIIFLVNWHVNMNCARSCENLLNFVKVMPKINIIGSIFFRTWCISPLYGRFHPCNKTRSFVLQARRNVFATGGYKFVRTLCNLVVKVVCLKFWHKPHLWLGRYRRYKSWTWGTVYPPVPIVPTPLLFCTYR